MTVLDVGCGAGFNCLGLARLGGGGEVIAADVQPGLLDVLEARARKAGMSGRIGTHLCEATDIGVRQPVDFVNAFWMVHETPDDEEFFRQVGSCLRPGGHLFVAEPWFHISSEKFQRLIETAEGLGFEMVARPRVWFSRAVVLRRNGDGCSA
jgi:2-polyprenyl-3-methyl-5-hydroxy-6-metoxy-1,4-benzoquinol methylase